MDLTIKISDKIVKEMVENQRRDYGKVLPPDWGVEEQVKNHFTSKKNNALLHIKEIQSAVKLDKKNKILDLGCGYGLMVILLKKMGYNVCGCDVNTGSIKIAKEIFTDNKIDNKILKINTEKLPYPDSTFDFIFMNYVLVYVKDLPSFFKEIKRILKKGGKVHFVTPNYQCGWDVNYQIFFLYWLPRWMNKIYVRLLGRDPSLINNISFTNKHDMESIFRKQNFEFENIGIKEWVKILDKPELHGRSDVFKKIIALIKTLHLEPIFKFTAKMGFYSPLIYVLTKK